MYERPSRGSFERCCRSKLRTPYGHDVEPIAAKRPSHDSHGSDRSCGATDCAIQRTSANLGTPRSPFPARRSFCQRPEFDEEPALRRGETPGLQLAGLTQVELTQEPFEALPNFAAEAVAQSGDALLLTVS
jgi:hypothetical protein